MYTFVIPTNVSQCKHNLKFKLNNCYETENAHTRLHLIKDYMLHSSSVCWALIKPCFSTFIYVSRQWVSLLFFRFSLSLSLSCNLAKGKPTRIGSFESSASHRPWLYNILYIDSSSSGTSKRIIHSQFTAFMPDMLQCAWSMSRCVEC